MSSCCSFTKNRNSPLTLLCAKRRSKPSSGRAGDVHHRVPPGLPDETRSAAAGSDRSLSQSQFTTYSTSAAAPQVTSITERALVLADRHTVNVTVQRSDERRQVGHRQYEPVPATGRLLLAVGQGACAGTVGAAQQEIDSVARDSGEGGSLLMPQRSLQRSDRRKLLRLFRVFDVAFHASLFPDERRSSWLSRTVTTVIAALNIAAVYGLSFRTLQAFFRLSNARTNWYTEELGPTGAVRPAQRARTIHRDQSWRGVLD